MLPQYVYIGMCRCGRVKIGVTRFPRSRVSMQRLRLLALIPNATWQTERQIHQLFGSFRQEGEWFRAAPALLNFALWLRHAQGLSTDETEALGGTKSYNLVTAWKVKERMEASA